MTARTRYSKIMNNLKKIIIHLFGKEKELKVGGNETHPNHPQYERYTHTRTHTNHYILMKVGYFNRIRRRHILR